tara:strand:- start:233 stop:469 length:237 start_codon:yes stop_codon:yes gene_type:complete
MLDFINNQIKAAAIDPKKITVIATMNFILYPSNISWAVSVFLLFFVIYFFVFPKIQTHKVHRLLKSESTNDFAKNLID